MTDKDRYPRIRRCARCRDGEAGSNGFCRSCQETYHRAWRAKNPDRWRAHIRGWKERHPEKVAAHAAVRVALRDGALTKGACYAAGPDCAGRTEAHHPDYTRPLAVVWTCRRHHRALDRARRQEAA